MGIFLNQSNLSFVAAIEDKIYVDKSGIIKYTNEVLGKRSAFICNSRPRRFGKSMAVELLNAYYSKGCKSRELFSNLEIAKYPSFEKHLNKYDTIHLDIQGLITSARGKDKVVEYINETITNELREEYPSLIEHEVTLKDALTIINAKTGNKFVILIDEWDVLIRDAEPNIGNSYIDFLRGLFKCAEASSYIALAYLTGILPIKKVQTQSALNNFDEFTFLNPGPLSPYVGFTKDEVQALCKKFNGNYDLIQKWYDGYLINGEHIYNPKAVVSAIKTGCCINYWTGTASFEAITPYINMNYAGLKDDILKMLSGVSVPVNVSKFSNDLRNVRSRDEVLTLLIHLGYLGFDSNNRTAFIPNEEIREELSNAIEECNWNEFILFKNRSDKLLESTLLGEEERVASILEEIHSLYSSALTYNDENALTSTILIGYLSSMSYYLKPIREFPSGKGFADVVYIPKSNSPSLYPPLLIELKWDNSTKTAIDQIKEKNYPESLEEFGDNLLIVGATYEKKTKKHRVKIERLVH